MSTVIKVENLSKRYRLGLKETRKDTLFQQLGHTLTAPIRNFKNLRSMTRFEQEDESVFWALRDINFEVKQGEVLGIIGHNGAGKSTLLKLLSRITEPTTGSITLKGRVAALLEVGTGFHQDLSGRENIYMNGTILGMTKKEIDRKLEEIVDFSGVEKHLDTPVKFYSSGMKVRLGFSVAAHLEPEILIIDEVLAVGDAEFQKKCLGKMEDVATEGRTVLFVSHNLGIIKNLAKDGLSLSKGKIASQGSIEFVCDKYIQESFSLFGEYNNDDLFTRKGVRGDLSLKLETVTFNDYKKNVGINTILSGQPVKIKFKFQYISKLKIRNLHIAIAFSDITGGDKFICDNFFTGDELDELMNDNQTELNLFIPKWPLNTGTYKYRIHIENQGILAFRLEDAGLVNVEFSNYYETIYQIPEHLNVVFIDHHWSL